MFFWIDKIIWICIIHSLHNFIYIFYRDGCNYYWLGIYYISGGLPIYENNQLIPKTYNVKIINTYADTVDTFINIREIADSCSPVMMWTKDASYYQIEVSDGYVTYVYTTNYFCQDIIMVDSPIVHDYVGIVIEPTKTEDGYTIFLFQIKLFIYVIR